MIWAAAVPSLVAGVNQVGSSQPSGTVEVLPQPAAVSAAWQIADMDRNCRACRDFYRFANGGWLDRNSLPVGQSRWGTYDEVDVNVQRDLRAIVDDGVRAASAGRSGTLAKIGTFWATCMDEERAEREGVTPLAGDLAQINAIRTREDVLASIMHLTPRLPDFLFDASVAADPLNHDRRMLHLGQGGLSLPEASLYADVTPEGVAARNTLLSAAAEMFRASGMTEADATAEAILVLALETEMAAATAPPEDARDELANYHPVTLAQANALTPHWSWERFLAAIGAPADSPMQIAQPRFFEAVDRTLAGDPLRWKAYLRWHLLRNAAPWLSKPFRDARFAFYSHFSGVRGVRPREQRCMSQLNGILGRALGAIYQERNFTPETRRRGERMVANLKAAMAERINQATWMRLSTRRRALAKLANVRVYLGGPTEQPDYSSLDVGDGPFWANVTSGYQYLTRFYVAKLDRPVDRGDWRHLPQDISGGADSERNAFEYPTGKFQPPFFDPAVDDALNYGALGATMGHELTHLFDDQGRKHDENGRLRDWWSPGDAAAYQARADRLVRFFGTVSVGGERVNGALTVGENIADLGGLTIAYRAFQREIRGKPRRLIDGYTPEQRFFLAWARNFREISTPEQLRRQIRSDAHSPAQARVNGPLANMPEFQRAFGCKEGDPMYRSPRVRVRVW